MRHSFIFIVQWVSNKVYRCTANKLQHFVEQQKRNHLSKRLLRVSCHHAKRHKVLQQDRMACYQLPFQRNVCVLTAKVHVESRREKGADYGIGKSQTTQSLILFDGNSKLYNCMLCQSSVLLC